MSFLSDVVFRLLLRWGIISRQHSWIYTTTPPKGEILSSTLQKGAVTVDVSDQVVQA